MTKYTPKEIRARRLRAKLTQPALAAELGVTAQTIKNWEAGRRGISPRYHAQLEQLLGAPRSQRVRVNSRPKYVDLAPGDWEAASKYGWCELKYDGEYCELRGGPTGWTITNRRGREIASGAEPMPVCHLLMERIVGTEWARRSELHGTYVAWGALSSKGVHLSREHLRGFYAALHFAGLPVTIPIRINPAAAASAWSIYVKRAGWEGLIFRTAGGKFARMKKRVTMDYVMMGYTWSIEQRSINGGLYNGRGKLIEKVSVPHDGDIPSKPGHVFEASGLAVTARGSLRNPRFERWRPDKCAEECVIAP